jgi:hypothetical protein
MLSSQKKKLLDELIASASKEELAWINGYMSGILLGGEIPQATALKYYHLWNGDRAFKKTGFGFCNESKKDWHQCKIGEP